MITHGDAGNGAYYTVHQAAAKLGVTEQRVRQLCVDRVLKADKENGMWLVDMSAVHERLAARPPKARRGEEAPLEEQRHLIDKLVGENRDLAVLLGCVLAWGANLSQEVENLGQEVENLTRILEERSRELVAERESHLRSTEESSRVLEEKQAEIKRLQAEIKRLQGELRDGSTRPYGSRGPRL